MNEEEALMFYKSPRWKMKRAEVLKLDRYECQRCKAMGRYSRAVIVHHVVHLRDNKELALAIWNGKERQLVSVCKRCHEELHPEAYRQNKNKFQKKLTEERWD